MAWDHKLEELEKKLKHLNNENQHLREEIDRYIEIRKKDDKLIENLNRKIERLCDTEPEE